jgi:hypothetical protein
LVATINVNEDASEDMERDATTPPTFAGKTMD